MVKFVEKLLFPRGVQGANAIRCLTIGFHKLKRHLCRMAITIVFYILWICYLLPIRFTWPNLTIYPFSFHACVSNSLQDLIVKNLNYDILCSIFFLKINAYACMWCIKTASLLMDFFKKKDLLMDSSCSQACMHMQRERAYTPWTNSSTIRIQGIDA